MKLSQSLWQRAGIGALALCVAPVAIAQSGAFGGGFGPPLQVVKPPKEFATSEEHYAYLLQQAKGGTKHTLATVPRWDGLWQPAGNTHLEVFIDGPGFQGKVREGVLTPEYEVAYKERWREQTELGQVNYDRLGHCEPPGYPRILLEPYTHEFINLPDVAHQINDFGPSIRRTYIGKEHSNVYGTHSWYGDTIGFWDGDALITWTSNILPWKVHGNPEFSGKLQTIEIYTPNRDAAGTLIGLNHEGVFYDPEALVEPVRMTRMLERRTGFEEGAPYEFIECVQTIFPINGRATPVVAGRTIEFTVPNLFDRPWARLWEQYHEKGMQRPQEKDLIKFD